MEFANRFQKRRYEIPCAILGMCSQNQRNLLLDPVLDASIVSPTQSSYDLLTAATIADDGLDFVAPAGWSYQIVSGGNGQVLRAVNGSTPVENADFNADGTVDGADFLIWQAGFGPSGTLTSGDANNDSVVDSADLAVWTAQFGTPPSPVASVPEPAALLLEMLGLALFRPIVARFRSASRC